MKMGLFFEEITFVTELLGSNFMQPRFLTGGKWDFQVANLLLPISNLDIIKVQNWDNSQPYLLPIGPNGSKHAKSPIHPHE